MKILICRLCINLENIIEIEILSKNSEKMLNKKCKNHWKSKTCESSAWNQHNNIKLHATSAGPVAWTFFCFFLSIQRFLIIFSKICSQNREHLGLSFVLFETNDSKCHKLSSSVQKFYKTMQISTKLWNSNTRHHRNFFCSTFADLDGKCQYSRICNIFLCFPNGCLNILW